MVNGTWSLQYDSLNRFSSATSGSGPFQGYAMNEVYDTFGNRTSQTVTYNGSPTQQTIRTDFDGSADATCPHAGSNRLCSTSINGLLPTDPTQGMDNGHDAAGNLLSDVSTTIAMTPKDASAPPTASWEADTRNIFMKLRDDG